MFKGEIKGQHADKTWLEQARECMKTTVEQDSTDMEEFGGDTVYIQTLKKILEMYDPNVAYNTSKGCSDTDKNYQVCANRRAFILFFHDQIKIDPRDPRTPKKIRVRNVPLNPKRLKSKLGRATEKGNALIDPQFRDWLSKDEYETGNKPRDIFKKPYPKPDFFSPVPPYPRVEIEGWNAPLGYTSWGRGNVQMQDDPDMQFTERAHLVESAAQKWLQYLVNYESIDNPNFFKITGSMDIIDVKSRLAALHKANKTILSDGDDKDPDYYIPNNFENMKQSDLYGIELYTLDSAANIVVINHRAHYMLLDNWLVDHGGTPNMSSGDPHDFFTIDTTGQVHGVVKLSTKDGREWISTRKKDGRQFRTGVGPNSRINPYWYDVSDEMFKRDRVQWLQNYRRKRWTQIRNIISAFMVEANANPSIDQNDEQNVCDPSNGCKYSRPPASQQHWTSQYDEEWTEYQNYLSEHGLAKQLEDMTMTGETKDDRPPSKQKTFGQKKKKVNTTKKSPSLQQEARGLVFVTTEESYEKDARRLGLYWEDVVEAARAQGRTIDETFLEELSELHEYRPPSVGDRLSKMEKMDDGTTRWFDGTIVKKTKTNTITIKWDDATYKNERYALKEFKRLYGTVVKYLDSSTTTMNGVRPSSKKQMTATQKKKSASSTATAVISADYDGCFDVLFPDIEANYRSDYPDDDIEKDRQELLAHILQIEKKYDNIILLVGSTRQTPGIDKKIRNIMNINRTIRFDTKTDDNLCFVNFATLAKERGWEFRDDVQFPDEIKADKSKVALIKAQLELSFVYAHHDCDFYFFDNDKKIIEKTTKAFQDSKNINIIRFEWT